MAGTRSDGKKGTRGHQPPRGKAGSFLSFSKEREKKEGKRRCQPTFQVENQRRYLVDGLPDKGELNIRKRTAPLYLSSWE